MIDKSPIGFIDPTLLPWLPEAGIPGLSAKTLASDEATGSYTRLLKFQPGTNTSPAGIQSHDHLEELWLVEGAIFDLTLNQNFVTGMYANRLYGMDHGPWVAEGGAVTFELRDRDPDQRIRKPNVEFVDPELQPWTQSDPAGVHVKMLTYCPDTGSYGRLVKFQAGAGSPALEGELARSELWVVSGTLAGPEGVVAAAGTYGNLDIDLLDGSWTSVEGCLVFEVRNVL